MKQCSYDPIIESELQEDTVIKDYLPRIKSREDKYFIHQQLEGLPNEFKKAILEQAFKRKLVRERNLFILRTRKRIDERFPSSLRNHLCLDEDGIANLSEIKAEQCENIAKRATRNERNKSKRGGEIPLEGSETEQNNSLQVSSSHPLLSEISAKGVAEIYDMMSEKCLTLGIKAPVHDGSDSKIRGAILRLCDKSWWKRRLRKAVNQAYEHIAIELNLVHRLAGMYSSNFTEKRRRQQRLHNDNMLACITVVNDVGQRYSLKDLSDLNVSNPKIRKDEMMVRIRGFEDYAIAYADVGLFITMTCPSKYHAVYAKSGQPNPNYQGFTPYESNQYLKGVWSRIRAELDRLGIKPYGFRVAEPQHDGTPHWHLLLFVAPEHMESMAQVFRHYNLMEDGGEKGANENRVDIKPIDSSKGSATGYIAKYISKNIDGEGLEEGVYGENPILAAQRVDAWASCWSIRQFQQMGGPSVTVWREFRRLRQQLNQCELLESIRHAADTSNWKEFTEKMGGIFIKRKDRPARPAYDQQVDVETGEIKTNRYDNDIVTAIKGIFYQGQLIPTRFFNWRCERAPNKLLLGVL